MHAQLRAHERARIHVATQRSQKLHTTLTTNILLLNKSGFISMPTAEDLPSSTSPETLKSLYA